MKFHIISRFIKLSNKIQRLLNKNRIFLVVIFFVGVAADLFYFRTNSDLRLFTLMALWVIIIKLYHFKSDATLKLALGYLGLLFIFFLLARGSFLTERTATWLYLLLVGGITQQLFELKEESKQKA